MKQKVKGEKRPMSLLLPGGTQLPDCALRLPLGRQPQYGKWASQRQAWPQSSPTLRGRIHMTHISHVYVWQEGWAQRSQAGRRSSQKAPPRNRLKTNNQ